ncbi:TPP2 [Biomphalaria glabrata]|nr:CATPP2 [Biomphalaria glabrata]
MADFINCFLQFDRKTFLQKQVAKLSRVLVGKTNGQTVWSGKNKTPEDWPSDWKWKNPTSTPKDTMEELEKKLSWLRSQTEKRKLLSDELKKRFEIFDENNDNKMAACIKGQQQLKTLRKINEDLQKNKFLVPEMYRVLPELQNELKTELAKLSQNLRIQETLLITSDCDLSQDLLCKQTHEPAVRQEYDSTAQSTSTPSNPVPSVETKIQSQNVVCFSKKKLEESEFLKTKRKYSFTFGEETINESGSKRQKYSDDKLEDNNELWDSGLESVESMIAEEDLATNAQDESVTALQEIMDVNNQKTNNMKECQEEMCSTVDTNSDDFLDQYLDEASEVASDSAFDPEGFFNSIEIIR